MVTRVLTTKRTLGIWPIAILALSCALVIQIINFKKKEDFAVTGILAFLFIFFFRAFTRIRAISYDENAVYCYGFFQSETVRFTQIIKFRRDFGSTQGYLSVMQFGFTIWFEIETGKRKSITFFVPLNKMQEVPDLVNKIVAENPMARIVDYP